MDDNSASPIVTVLCGRSIEHAVGSRGGAWPWRILDRAVRGSRPRATSYDDSWTRGDDNWSHSTGGNGSCTSSTTAPHPWNSLVQPRQVSPDSSMGSARSGCSPSFPTRRRRRRSPPSGTNSRRIAAARARPGASQYAHAVSGGIEVGSKRAADLENSLRRLDVVARQLYADRGLWTLYVGLLMLQWVDPDDKSTVVSPIVLLPVELTRTSRDQPFVVQRNQEDLLLNPTLKLKMEELGVDLQDLDADELSLIRVGAAVKEAIADRPGWGVVERAVLTTFSFQKEAIYRDLTDNAETILADPHVQLLGLGPDSTISEALAFDPPDQDTLDDKYPPERLASILDADSSQRACIVSARDGKSFVMDGPPGTGKSQTIANIIVELMSAGKTVLFVSEKAAALDVVRDRLAAADLRSFLFELHSHAATRKQVVEELNTTLHQQVRTRSQFSDGNKRLLESLRGQLSGYAAAMNEVRVPLGRSVFGVIGNLQELPVPAVAVPTSAFWSALSDDSFLEIVEHAAALSRSWRPILEGDDFLWRDLIQLDSTDYSIHQLTTTARSAAATARRLIDTVSAVDDDLGTVRSLGLSDIIRRTRLIELAEMRPAAVDSWLSGPELDSIKTLMADRRSRTSDLLDVQTELESTAGARWSEVDDSALGMVRDLGLGSWAPTADTTADALHSLLGFLDAAPDRLKEIAADAGRLGRFLGLAETGLTVQRAIAYSDIGMLAENSEKPQPAWLNPTIQVAVQEAMTVLTPLTELVRKQEKAMRELFTDEALELDLQGLEVRFRESHRWWRYLSQQARADRATLKAVAVRKKVDRQLRERLADAVIWQKTSKDLDEKEKERDRAKSLGTTYHRTETDFSKIGTALDVARQAVWLAGADVDAAGLARQIADGGSPDPNLTLIAHRLADAVTRWLADLEIHLDARAAAQISPLTLEMTESWISARQVDLARPLGAVIGLATLSNSNLTIAQARSVLESARRLRELTEQIEATRRDDEHLLGPLYTGTSTHWDALGKALEWALQVRSVNGGPLSPSTAERFASLSIDSSVLKSRIAEWLEARDQICGSFTDRRESALKEELDSDIADGSDLLDEMADSGTRDIDEWISFEQERRALGQFPLVGVVQRMCDDRLAQEQVAGTVEAAVLRAWLDSTVERDERLRRYQASSRQALVEQFKDLDHRIVVEANSLVAERCGARRPKSMTSTPAQVIIREANKKTRHKPIRQLLNEVGEFATELKPCFMMSPLTVSMFLSTDIRFDAVIFDEASQVLPADAINCIYRGRQLVVAGDQKQLPPTDFFARVEDAESEDEDIDAFQSVLDLCKAAGGLSSLPLTWHYRSRHEDLITYSNYRFYGGTLKTFPGASFESADLGVELFLVDGEYRRSGARDNPAEARRVAERVLHHVRNRPGLSLGVVTFSVAQEDAVRAALEVLGNDAPDVAELLEQNDRLDGFFVKSLESVQGDERDVIIFSIGYGPDENKKFTMNFGPLNREGGWRRLNVAITRARRRVELVSSFRANQITETRSDGVRHLRGYLDFAERGRAALAQEAPASLGDAESVFEEQVAQVIRSWGFVADTQVGAAGYRIDIAIRHPDRPGEYVLAVECDGAAYHSARVARDRDRLREQVLVGLGWRVHRIWGISWWRDRQTQESRLRSAIEASVDSAGHGRIEPGKRPGRPVQIEFDEVDPEALPAWVQPYRFVSSVSDDDRLLDARTPEARPALRRFLERVLRVEAPIHESLLFERVRVAWGIGRVRSQTRSNVQPVLDRIRIDGREVRRNAGGFYHIAGQDVVIVRGSTGSEPARTVLQVPGDEIDLAVIRCIRDAIVVEQEQLITAVRTVFGWRRAGADIQNSVNASISRLVQQGVLQKDQTGGLRVTVPPGGF